MKQTPFSELNQNQLKIREKALKTAVVILSGMLLILFAITGYLTFVKGFSVFSILPFIFLPIFLIKYPKSEKNTYRN